MCRTFILLALLLVINAICGCATKKQLMPYQGTTAPGRFVSLAFTRDSQMLAAANAIFGGIELYEVPTLRQLGSIPSNADTVEFSPSGNVLAFAADGEVQVWSVILRKKVTSLACNNGKIMSFDFSPKDNVLATGCSNGSVLLWNTSTWQKITKFQAHSPYSIWRGGGVVSLAFSPDGNRLATGSDDGTKLWKLADQSAPLALPDCSVPHSLVFSPDGTRVAASCSSFTKLSVTIWNTTTGERLTTLEAPGNPFFLGFSIIGRVSFSADGSIISAVLKDFGWIRRRDEIRLWEIDSGKVLTTIPGKDIGLPLFEGITGLHSADFSPDGKIIAVGGEHVWLWRVPDLIGLTRSKKEN